MRSFTDLLPLRTTSAWSAFRAVVPIPHRYGPTAGELIQYDNARRLFVWADHACDRVIEVRIGGLVVAGWDWYNGVDSTGAPVTFVRFSQPVDEGAVATASGIGKLHSRTGVAITNPADALFDLLANICGMSVAESDLDAFRRSAARAQLTIAGSLADPAMSIQTQAAALCASFGAVFGATMPGYARIFPGGDLDAYAPITVDPGSGAAVRSAATRDGICNALTVSFDYDSSGPRQSVRLEAPDSIARYGRHEATLEARYIGRGRIAVDIGTRRLQWVARPRWAITAAGLRTVALKPGQTASVAHVRIPYAGAAMIQAVEVDVIARRSTIALEAAAGDVPRVTIAQQSAAIEAQQYASISVQTRGTDRVLQVLDANNAPLANAICLLDGQIPRVTDGGGIAVFPASLMPAGEHTILVTSGSTSLTFTVIVQ